MNEELVVAAKGFQWLLKSPLATEYGDTIVLDVNNLLYIFKVEFEKQKHLLVYP